MKELSRYEYAVQSLLGEMSIYGHDCFERSREALHGDIVMLQCAPQSEWHLSIYVERLGDDMHMLESLKTGAKCRWSNVGIRIVKREWIASHPRIRWTDEQFSFCRRFDAEVARGGYYWDLPCMAEFTQSALVIGTRTRFSSDSVRTLSDPIFWHTLSRADIRCLLAIQVRKHKGARDLLRAAA